MTPKWLIEADVFSAAEDERLIAELIRQKIPHVVTKFGKSYEEYFADFEDNDCVIFHGSLQFGAMIRRKTNWTGLFCNLPKFECLYYYPHFGEHLLNGEYVMLPFGELNRRKDWLFANVGIDGKMFIRPSSGFKTFTGMVTSFETWDKDFKLFDLRIVPETLVLVSPPAKINREWRIVVVDGKVIAGSEYKTDSPQNPPNEVFEYSQKVVNFSKFNPDPVWTIDVCETGSREFKVVEVGSFSCAGLYACDPEPIVTQVTTIALREWKNNL